jgi:hypothetical protein
VSSLIKVYEVEEVYQDFEVVESEKIVKDSQPKDLIIDDFESKTGESEITQELVTPFEPISQ